MEHKLVLVLVDALKSKYLRADTMPFLYELANQGFYIKDLIPSPGFCERSEIFTGLDCYDSGNYTAIGFFPERSPYKKYRLLLRLLNLTSHFTYRYSRAFLSRARIKLRIRMNNYLIPIRSLDKFALTEDGGSRYTQYEDIFDSLRNSGKSYNLNFFTALSDLSPRSKDSIEVFVTDNTEKCVDFIPTYIGITDSEGHKCGGDVDMMRSTLLEVDKTLRNLYEISIKKGYKFAVLGDHGMVPVAKKVDMQQAVQELGLPQKQYEMFLDSNIARFWFFSNHAKEQITSMINYKFADTGIIVNQDNYERYRIPLDIVSRNGKPIYGDLVWCANPGVLISPDFFHNRFVSENGMHGYLKTDMEHGMGQFVAVGKGVESRIIESAQLKDICGVLCNLLQISKPNSEKWKRIVR